MNAILRAFNRPRVLFPVVHCVDSAQVQRAVEVAMGNGADGVFLINQGGFVRSEVVRAAKSALASGAPFVGVNLLGLRADDALDTIGTTSIPGLWCDDAKVWLDHYDGPARAVAANARLLDRRFFGGVALKYRREIPVARLGEIARMAVEAGVEIITTSGPATGSPPTVGKVAAMRAAIGDHALAIASGITPENVGAFLPYVDAFLVATGIEDSFGVFDPGKVRALADQIHGYQSAGGTT